MMSIFLQDSSGKAEILAIRFKNEPSIKSAQVKFLCESILLEGQWKQYDNKHEIRLDRRPDNMGGDQIHVRRADGKEWAYRHNGLRSEPNKYTSSATNTVRDIVASQFNIEDLSIIENICIISADDNKILFEVSFR